MDSGDGVLVPIIILTASDMLVIVLAENWWPKTGVPSAKYLILSSPTSTSYCFMGRGCK